jgi:hypothetical protein
MYKRADRNREDKMRSGVGFILTRWKKPKKKTKKSSLKEKNKRTHSNTEEKKSGRER